jgi:hypothetical protein
MRVVRFFFILLVAGNPLFAQQTGNGDLYKRALQDYQKYIKVDTVFLIIEDTSKISSFNSKFCVVKIMENSVKGFMTKHGYNSIPAIKIKQLGEVSKEAVILLNEFGVSIDGDKINMVYSGGEKFVYRSNKRTGKIRLIKQVHVDF